MKKAKPWLFIIAGVVFILVAVALLTLTQIDNYRAGQRADSVMERILNGEWEQSDETDPNILFAAPVPSAVALELTDDELGFDLEEEGPRVPGAPLEYSVIGILEIPKLRKKLPVLDRSISVLLNISVCRYSGRVNEKPVRLVIAGHNLKSYFGQIKTLESGDEILFTPKDGETIRYNVIRIDECHQSDIEGVQAGADWDITLLTCKKERTKRLLVRCAEISE